MAASNKLPVFNGKGDVNAFIVKMGLHIALKKVDNEEAAMTLASRLEEPAFNVYMRLSTADQKDIEKIKTALNLVA